MEKSKWIRKQLYKTSSIKFTDFLESSEIYNLY